MKILGIDTSSKFLSIALSEHKESIVEQSFLLERNHSSLLIPKVKIMLEEREFSIDKVQCFVVGLGPGSFTGLRIGVSTVKGFGIATGKPCVGIPSIDALALNVDIEKGLVIPVIDAKRGQFYSAIYKKRNFNTVRKSPYLLLDVHGLAKRIKTKECIFFLGDGISLYRDKIEKLNRETVFLEERYWYPKADSLIKLALSKISGRKKNNLAALNPLYLYPKDCQVK